MKRLTLPQCVTEDGIGHPLAAGLLLSAAFTVETFCHWLLTGGCRAIVAALYGGL